MSLKLFQLYSFHQLDGIEDGLFFGLIAVFIHINDIARTMSDAHRAIETAAVASHAFEEVFGGLVEFQLGQSGLAFGDAVHGDRLHAFHAHFLGHVSDTFGDAARLGENAAIVGSVVQLGVLFFKKRLIFRKRNLSLTKIPAKESVTIAESLQQV